MNKQSRTPGRVRAERLCAVIISVIIWQIAAVCLNSTLLLATPVRVAQELCRLVLKHDFWATIWFSFLRIVAGYSAALTVGCLLAILAARFRVFESLFWPVMSVIKATPVASFIILCLIAMSSRNLSIFISFLMVLPIVYTNVLQGLLATDRKIVEMAGVFRLSWFTQFLYIYLPQVKPYLISACSLSLGIAWKSGVAAEVICPPKLAIGTEISHARTALETPELFAWTLVIIARSLGLERLLRRLLNGRGAAA